MNKKQTKLVKRKVPVLEEVPLVELFTISELVRTLQVCERISIGWGADKHLYGKSPSEATVRELARRLKIYASVEAQNAESWKKLMADKLFPQTDPEGISYLFGR